MKIKIKDKILLLEQGFNILVENKHVFDDFLKAFNWDNVYGFVGYQPFRTKEEAADIDNETKVFYLDDVYCYSAMMSGSKKTTDILSYGDKAIASLIKHLDSHKYDIIIINNGLNNITPLLQITLIKKLQSLDNYILFIEKNPLILQLCNMKANWFISENDQINMKKYQTLIKDFNDTDK